MLTLVLRREGFVDNHKRIERIYQEEGLQVRKRRRKRRKCVSRPRVTHAEKLPNDRWSADFVHDAFLDGRPFRCLTIVDHVANDSVAIVVGRTIGGQGVVDTLERLKIANRMPRTLQVDNGPEFRSFVLDQWCYENGVTLDFIQPGKPTQNAKIESFNGRFREE
jgi:putative transposase